jgi:hypothetical protein
LFRRTFAALLGGILLLTISGFKPAQAKTGKDVPSPEQVRASVLKLGTGKNARVEIRLNDNSSLKGYVSEAGEQSFTVVDSKTGASHPVAYGDVLQVKKKSNGLSSQTKWIIGAAAVAGAGIVLYIVRGAFCDGMC